jgi:hypothetical protein
MRRFFAVLFAVLAIGGASAGIAAAGQNHNSQGCSQGTQGQDNDNQH